MQTHSTWSRGIVAAALVSVLSAGASVWACPFCSAVQQTLSEEIAGADAAILATLGNPSGGKSSAASVDNKTKFKIQKVLKGKKELGDAREIEVLYFGDELPDTQFLVIATDPKELAWGTPTALSARAAKYVAALVELPETGAERLAFFQDYFEDKDPLLAGDSYDEFAKAPYPEIVELRPRLHHDQLLKWIKDTEVSTSHRRLYLTLLGVCGTQNDVAPLEAMIRDDNRQMRAALDALIACYLNLRGADGLPLIEELFLRNPKAEYTDTYATIMALRFHGQETTVVPRDRLTAAMRLMLDRPQLADLVIPDLARWEDWSVMDRLVQLFKDANDDSIWVRVPVVNYLRACPLPEAKKHIEELAKIDPDAVKRASNFFPLGSAAKAPKGATRPKDSTDKKELGTKTVEEQPEEELQQAEPDDESNSAELDSKSVGPDGIREATPQPRPDGAAEIVPPDNEKEPGLGLVLPVSAGIGAVLLIVTFVLMRGGAPRTG